MAAGRKKEKSLGWGGASSGHITNLKQFFFCFNIYDVSSCRSGRRLRCKIAARSLNVEPKWSTISWLATNYHPVKSCFHSQSLLAKPSAVSCHEHAHLTFLGYLGEFDTNRIISIYAISSKVAKANRVGIIKWWYRWQFCKQTLQKLMSLKLKAVPSRPDFIDSL